MYGALANLCDLEEQRCGWGLVGGGGGGGGRVVATNWRNNFYRGVDPSRNNGQEFQNYCKWCTILIQLCYYEKHTQEN